VADENTRFGVNFVGPGLPFPPKEHSSEHLMALNNVLRLYFNNVDNALRNIGGARLLSSQDGDYTTGGNTKHEIVLMTNSAYALVKLNSSPNDLEEVTIKRTDGPVRVDGNGNTIDGEEFFDLSLYDSIHAVYSTTTEEWSIIMSYFGLEKDSNGNTKVTDSKLTEAIETVVLQLQLLNTRFEEAYGTLIKEEDM